MKWRDYSRTTLAWGDALKSLRAEVERLRVLREALRRAWPKLDDRTRVTILGSSNSFDAAREGLAERLERSEP